MDEKYGALALEFGGLHLPVRVCKSAAGYYLGTLNENGLPFSRESVEYFPDEASATGALANGSWTQRDEP